MSPNEALARLKDRLRDTDHANRIGAVYELADLHGEPSAVAELIETLKNDTRGEVVIVAAAALASMPNTHTILDALTRAFTQCKGRWSTANADPGLRICYALAMMDAKAFFEKITVSDFHSSEPQFQEKLRKFIRAGHLGDQAAASALITYFEYLDEICDVHLLVRAASMFPTVSHWINGILNGARVGPSDRQLLAQTGATVRRKPKRWWQFWK